MKIERIDYAARARDRLDSVLRKIGPEPSPPDVESQRRAIAQQAFLMTRRRSKRVSTSRWPITARPSPRAIARGIGKKPMNATITIGIPAGTTEDGDRD